VRIFRLLLGIALGYAAVVVTVMFLSTLVDLTLGPRFWDIRANDSSSLSQVAVVLVVSAASAWCGGFAAVWWGGGRVCGYLLAGLLFSTAAIGLLAARTSGAISATPFWIAALASIVGGISAVVGTHSPRALHRRTNTVKQAHSESA